MRHLLIPERLRLIDESAAFNLTLYAEPTVMTMMAIGKPEDLIDYRCCPHFLLDEKGEIIPRPGFIAFCFTHLAFMCGQCYRYHSFECTRRKDWT